MKNKKSAYKRENIIFYGGAFQAFQAFYDNYLQHNEHAIAISSQEYQPIVNLLKGREVLLPEFTGDTKKYQKELQDFFNQVRPFPKYILISEVTRFGQVNTEAIKVLHTVILDLPKQNKPFVIIDGAQSFGRIESNFAEIKPDVYLSCAHKA